MTTQTEQALREALAFDPSTPSLSAGPVIASVRRKQRRTVLLAVTTGVALITAGGFTLASWSDDVLDTMTVPASVTQVSGTFEIGVDRHMVVEDQALCLVDPHGGGSCGVNVAFEEGSTFSWLDGSPGSPIYVWVVRDSTATAALETPEGDVTPAQLYRVFELDLSIAVATRQPGEGWTHISRDAAGTVTDEVPYGRLYP